ncbi:MAG: ABC transporter ATP-binding protein [Clostridiales bacterium]|nr:ABC transporter ATP-binding protein [Clostridiales bacterium]
MNSEKLSFGESIRIFGKALKISMKAKTLPSYIVTLLGFPMAFIPTLIAYAIRSFSDGVQSLYGAGTAAIVNVLGMFVLLSCAYILQLTWNTVRNFYAKADALKILRYMKERILRCTCDVKYKYIENHDDFKQRIRFAETQAGERVAESMTMIIMLIQNIITFVSIIIVLLEIDVWVVVILIAACTPAVVMAYYFKDEEYISKTKWIYESLMAAAYYFESTWSNSINEVRFFGLYPWLKGKYRGMMNRYLVKKNKMTAKHTFFNALADLLRNGVYIAVLLITVRRIFENPSMGIGAFMLVFTMAGQLQNVTASIFVAAAQFASDVRYMQDFFYLDTLEYEKRDADAEPFESFDIGFENVSFSYPNTEREVLHNLNVRIREGEKVAIVGENGSGKSTFVSLLCALYEPDSGKITMGGEDIHINLSRTRKTLSAIFQDFAHYEATIRENITVSDGKRDTSEAQLLELAGRVSSLEVISEQPDGLDEIVGSFSPTGNNLSGGQWQKIAITRCAYRENANIMVLDEPTAALDPLAEAELYRNFASLTGERTTILISHRLGITSLVDRILVFDNGRIVEDGNHKTLMAQGRLYAKMYKAQAQWYN